MAAAVAAVKTAVGLVFIDISYSCKRNHRRGARVNGRGQERKGEECSLFVSLLSLACSIPDTRRQQKDRRASQSKFETTHTSSTQESTKKKQGHDGSARFVLPPFIEQHPIPPHPPHPPTVIPSTRRSELPAAYRYLMARVVVLARVWMNSKKVSLPALLGCCGVSHTTQTSNQQRTVPEVKVTVGCMSHPPM